MLLPVFLMLLKSLADIAFPEGHVFRHWMDFIGDPIVALLAALLLAFFTFGIAHASLPLPSPGCALHQGSGLRTSQALS